MKNFLDTKVSCFKNYRSVQPVGAISLLAWLNNNEYLEDVLKIRQETDKSVRDKLKSELPCITPSGIFSSRSVAGLTQHSGLICIDIDKKDNLNILNWYDLKAEIAKIRHVAYCGLSVSGEGYFVLIPIKYLDKHKEHFEDIKIFFKDFGIIVDKKCSDVSRLRGYSYDDSAYFNENAIIYSSYVKPPKAKPYKPYKPFVKDERVNRLIDEICIKAIDITSDYGEWFEIGCALASEYREQGQSLFHAVSKFYPKYQYNETDKQYNKCLKNAYSLSIGTFIYYCKRYGVE